MITLPRKRFAFPLNLLVKIAELFVGEVSENRPEQWDYSGQLYYTRSMGWAQRGIIAIGRDRIL